MNIEDILLAKGSQAPRTNIVQLDLPEESRRVYLGQGVSGTCPEMKNRKLLFNGHNAFHLCKIKESPGGGGKNGSVLKSNHIQLLLRTRAGFPTLREDSSHLSATPATGHPPNTSYFGGVSTFL